LKLRWTRLRTLFLVTGVVSVVLYVSAQEVEQIFGSGLLEAALTTGFAFSLIAVVLRGLLDWARKDTETFGK
jgi:hypothetical protein